MVIANVNISQGTGAQFFNPVRRVIYNIWTYKGTVEFRPSVRNKILLHCSALLERGKDDCISRPERPKGGKDEVTTRVQCTMS